MFSSLQNVIYFMNTFYLYLFCNIKKSNLFVRKFNSKKKWSFLVSYITLQFNNQFNNNQFNNKIITKT